LWLIIGVSVAAAIAVLSLICIFVMFRRERKGKPIFLRLDPESKTPSSLELEKKSSTTTAEEASDQKPSSV